ncbi:MAG: isoamylase, partial [Chthoniobacter sp.]|nr:isoamylase [Chthoniobacter sp.]
VRDFHGEPIHDDTFLLLLNAHHEPLKFVLPGQEDVRWELIVDTRLEDGFLETPKILAAADEHEMEARSFCMLRLSVGEQAHARSDSWKRREEKLAAQKKVPRGKKPAK